MNKNVGTTVRTTSNTTVGVNPKKNEIRKKLSSSRHHGPSVVSSRVRGGLLWPAAWVFDRGARSPSTHFFFNLRHFLSLPPFSLSKTSITNTFNLPISSINFIYFLLLLQNSS